MDRRRFLKRTGKAAVPLVATGVVVGAAAAVTYDHFEAQPDHVSLEYDQGLAEQYRPALVTRHLDIQPDAWYCWIATSPERETDAYVYWMEYPLQQGVSPFGGAFSDTHLGDHEPFYVYVDSAGEVVSAAWSGYHWIRAYADAATLPLVNDTHVAAWPVNPWHHYSLDPAKGGSPTTQVTDLRGAFVDWLANGWDRDLAPGTATNPWTMQGSDGRRSWWRGNSLGFSAAESVWATLEGTALYDGDAPEVDT